MHLNALIPKDARRALTQNERRCLARRDEAKRGEAKRDNREAVLRRGTFSSSLPSIELSHGAQSGVMRVEKRRIVHVCRIRVWEQCRSRVTKLRRVCSKLTSTCDFSFLKNTDLKRFEERLSNCRNNHISLPRTSFLRHKVFMRWRSEKVKMPRFAQTCSLNTKFEC